MQKKTLSYTLPKQLEPDSPEKRVNSYSAMKPSFLIGKEM